ncbi:MAG: GAF domain-containing protein [Pseudomonadota bacterium]
MMKKPDSLLDKLHQLAGFLDTHGTLDEQLSVLAERAAVMLSAAQCSIMLYAEGEPDAPRLQVRASYGALPEVAYTQLVAHGEGIAGQVAAQGVALLVEDIATSPYAHLARRKSHTSNSLMVVPIRAEGSTIGVMNVTHPGSASAFSASDLAMLEIIALLTGKAIQTVHLQNLLNSRFAQIALAQEADNAIGGVMLATAYDTDKMARIVARTFFREMTQAGFGSKQIIQAASEIISQLSGSLQKHSKRLEK